MRLIAITGSSGFVGKNLTKFLSPFANLIPLGREVISNAISNQFSGVDTIIHLAGKAHDLRKVSNSEEYYTANFEITKNLYDGFLKSDAKKFIFISSVKAAADSVEGLLTEEHHPEPKTDYGKSKLLAEQYIQNQALPTEKSYYILRPCMIHGPGNKGNLNLLYKFVQKGIPYPLASFDNKRSFLSVENLCYVIKELIERDDIPSGIYQVADDEPLSTNEVVSILATSINKKPRLWNIPANLVNTIVKIGDWLHLPLTTERLNKLTESYVVSNHKIKKVIGKSLPLTSRDGLSLTAKSFSDTIG